MDQTTYFAKPESEKCQARLEGCTGGREVRIYCRTEGSDMIVCRMCYHRWQRDAVIDRCPRCASLFATPHGPTGVERKATREFTLTGPAWLAINKAMHAEGLLIDQRMRILERLAQEAPWLENAEPIVLTGIVDRSGT